MPNKALNSADVVSSFDPSELRHLTPDAKATLAVLLAGGSVAQTPNVLALFLSVFPAGTATAAALTALWKGR